MNITQILKDGLSSAKSALASTEELYNSRMKICLECPDLKQVKIIHSTSPQCKRCGCMMEAKARLAHANCPINKW